MDQYNANTSLNHEDENWYRKISQISQVSTIKNQSYVSNFNNNNSFVQMNKDTLHGGSVSRKYLNNNQISKFTNGKDAKDNHDHNIKHVSSEDLSLNNGESNEYNTNGNDNYNSKGEQSRSKIEPVLFKVSIKLDHQAQGKIYVRGGDSLWSLAQKFAITHKLDGFKTNKV